jgi:class 3 adenylate cyclase/tetratricopeptide (TPR) repeat protein
MTPLRTCWSCGAENPVAAKFCVNCGKPQEPACPECGATVVEGAKFCANCGIRLEVTSGPPVTDAPVLTAESHKVVTVLFADLVGSTSLTEKHDPEEARQVTHKFYDVVQHVVERWFAGTMANLLGDAVLAVFGFPVAHEDDPERAVRAGLSIRDAMPVLNTHLTATHGVHLAVRVGINTGEVVAASGSTFDRDFLISDAVTTAARLQQTVDAGMVVVGERTYRLTRDAVEYRTLPPLAVKGKDAALPAWEAVAPLPEQAKTRQVVAPLIGRHAELGLLRHLYQRSRDDSRVHLATVVGEPGVGKSRLLREFLAELRDGDLPPQVLRGRSVSFGGQIGYHALLDILRSQAGLLDTDTTEEVQAKLKTWLQQVLPDRGSLLDGLLLTFGAPQSATADPAQQRQRLFNSWQALITGLAAARPVVMALEDLHWADDGVLDLVQRIAEHAGAVPLFLIGVARPEFLERRPNWGGDRRNATVIDLAPLRSREAEQLVASLGSQGLAPEVQAIVAQRAEGNPLFIEELVRMLQESSTPGTTIPDTIQAVLTARIDRLPPRERRVLQAAAVVGRSFWPSAVSPIAGLSSDDTAEAIEALIAKDLLVPRPRSSIADQPEYIFRHILTRDVAYAMLPKSQRQRAHAETARWLEQRLRDRLEEAVEILAEHLRLSGDDARAATFLHRAGNKARRLYANTDALHFFTQALDAATGVGLPPQQVAEIHRDRGEVNQLRGDYRGAMGDFEHALDAARQANDRGLQAVLENRIGLIHHRDLRLEEAEAHFVRAATLAREAGDSRTQGQSLVDLANIAWDRGLMTPDHPAIREGLDLLRSAADRPGLARGLNLLSMAHLSVGNGADAVAAVQEALAIARDAGDKSREATSLSYLCVIHGFLGHFDDALPYGQAALKLAQEIGDRRRVAAATFFLGRVQVNLGAWGDALQQLETSLQLSKELVRIQLPWVCFLLGTVRQFLGDVVGARTAWTAGAGLETHSPGWRQVALLCAINFARLEHDASAVNRALDEFLQLPWGVFIPADGDTLLPVGEALLEVGRLGDLRQFVAQRRPGLERFGAPQYLAAAEILDAHLALQAGETRDAITSLDRAIHRCEQCADAWRGWRAYELRLELVHDSRDREALQALLQRVALGLPDNLRATFLSSPRTAALHKGTSHR